MGNVISNLRNYGVGDMEMLCYSKDLYGLAFCNLLFLELNGSVSSLCCFNSSSSLIIMNGSSFMVSLFALYFVYIGYILMEKYLDFNNNHILINFLYIFKNNYTENNTN